MSKEPITPKTEGEEEETPDAPKINWLLLGVGVVMIGVMIFLADKFVVMIPKFEGSPETEDL